MCGIHDSYRLTKACTLLFVNLGESFPVSRMCQSIFHFLNGKVYKLYTPVG